MLAATFGNSWRLPDSEVSQGASGSPGSLPGFWLPPCPFLASLIPSCFCSLFSSLAFSLGRGLACSRSLVRGRLRVPWDLSGEPTNQRTHPATWSLTSFGLTG